QLPAKVSAVERGCVCKRAGDAVAQRDSAGSAATDKSLRSRHNAVLRDDQKVARVLRKAPTADRRTDVEDADKRPRVGERRIGALVYGDFALTGDEYRQVVYAVATVNSPCPHCHEESSAFEDGAQGKLRSRPSDCAGWQVPRIKGASLDEPDAFFEYVDVRQRRCSHTSDRWRRGAGDGGPSGAVV